MTWHQVTNMEANNYLLNKIADTKGLTTISPILVFYCRIRMETFHLWPVRLM